MDNDVIKEDPDRPYNAPHVCSGKDLVEVAVYRAKLRFYENNAASERPVSAAVEHFSDNFHETGTIIAH